MKARENNTDAEPAPRGEAFLVRFDIEGSGDWDTIMRVLSPFPLRRAALRSVAIEFDDDAIGITIDAGFSDLADAELIRHRLAGFHPVSAVRTTEVVELLVSEIGETCGDIGSMNLAPVQSLRAFEAAGRLMSFTKAAGELGVSVGAISQHVRMLESFAQARLFTREGRGVSLTARGRKAWNYANAALGCWRRASASMRA